MATLSQAESRRMYSWWWDSHISPKNSKWLQENLTEDLMQVAQRTSASPSVEVPKFSRNDSFPSPTPKSSTQGWTGGQASESKLSPSSFPIQQTGSVLGVNSCPGGNGPMQLPAVATRDSGQLTRSSTSSSINQSGIKEHNAMESIGVLAPASVLNSGTPGSLTSSSPAPYSEQGILLGSTTALPTSQTIVTSESHGIRPPIETHGWGFGSVPEQEMVAPVQTLSEPNSSLLVPVQPADYGYWGGIPSTVPNPAGNFPTPGFSALPQPDPWRPPPVAGNQSNIQPAAPSSVPWGMGVAETNSFALGPRPDNPNAGWGPTLGNANMGWGGPAHGTTNMNWGAAVQGPVAGTVNPGWVPSTGNPGAIIQGPVPGNANPGWAAQKGNPGFTSGSRFWFRWWWQQTVEQAAVIW